MSIKSKIKRLIDFDNRYGVKEIAVWLWHAGKGNRLQAILNAMFGFMDVALSLLSVWAVKHAVDVASGTIQGNIYWAVGLMGIIVLCDFAINIAQTWVKNILGVKAQNKMQQYLLDRILHSEWHGKESRHSGDVMNRLETDVKIVVNFLAETLPSTLSTLALFIGAFIYMFSMDKFLAIVTVAIIPIFVAFSRIYMQTMRKLSREVRDSDSEVQSVLQETIQNRMLIKTLEGDAAMVDKLENTQSALRKKVVKRTKFSLISRLILNFGFSFGYLVAFLWAALRLSAHTLTFGGMTAFLQLVNRIQGPARNLTSLAPAFVGVFTSAERLMELEDNPLEEEGDPLTIAPPCGLKLSDVCFAYEDGKDNVIDHLNFDFKPNTCTAILGETGAGKTTLIRLLMALMKPTAGSIDIYSQREGESEHLTNRHRCNFVYVPQGNTLMSGTIRDNLLLGDPDATEGRMIKALELSCAEFVFELPDGLDTECSERGGGLSEGQCQRISIARALLRNRPIMLFDESTSALDPETEQKLLQNILAENNKTVIFITHRLAVVDYCDQVLKM